MVAKGTGGVAVRWAGERLAALWQQGLDLLFPPACVACGRLGQGFCDRCAQAVAPVPQPVCRSCGRPALRAVDFCSLCRDVRHEGRLQAIRAAALFHPPLREAVHHLKYQGRRDLAPLLSRYLVAAFGQEGYTIGGLVVDVVVPVPLHPRRLAERGFNQSGLLAHGFGRRVGLTVCSDWLDRERETRPQVGLGLQERRENVAGAFRAQPQVAGCTVLLMDDVYTTGATLRACAAALSRAGARAVAALTLAQPAPAGWPPTPAERAR